MTDLDLAARVARLSLEQKVRLLTGADFWSLHPEPAAGLGRLVVSDGPAGVRGELWDERDPSANVPSPTALAATWDEDLVEALGGLLAAEARRKGVHVLLAPTVNLHRTPYGGRHFECFSEDPLLTARIGVAYVRGLQNAGVGATVKHFVANDSETERMTLDAQVDERALRELYLAPFEAIVREAGVWSVMAAYNGVNGATMTESPLLRQILHEEWGFDGLVMSDWFATRSTEMAANAALDLVMPGPHGPWGEALVAAVRGGKVAESTVDDKVLRLLRLAARVGALTDGPTPDVPALTPEQIALRIRETAAAGFVLVRNEGALLPLPASGLGTVAVLGPNAESARTLGGGSATVFPPYVVSPVDGLRAAGVQVNHAPGVRAHTRIPVARATWLRTPGGQPGAELRFVAANGDVVATEHRAGGAFTWLGAAVAPATRVEVHTTVVATAAGRYEVGGSGVGRFRLAVRGAEVFDAELALRPGADIAEALMTPPQRTYPVYLEAGESADVVLTYEWAPDGVGVIFQLNVDPPYGTDDEEIERAVALASDADVAVVVVGTTEEVESEGFDRTSLALPGRQDELVRRVAAANPRTVVVVNAGAPVLLPWADEVAAVLLAWFPGQEFGNALADVLLGLAEPGGRLPTTWPRTEDGLPQTRPVDGVLKYGEGLAVGYRGPGPEPRYPFGHGLGYTSWEYASVSCDVTESDDVVLTVRVRNTGQRAGREVVQVYASRPGSAIDRPARWLAGFAAVTAAPGEEATATVTVRARAFQHWDGGWATEPGRFGLHIGRSAVDTPLGHEVAVR
jgi:beta-glucosidase